MVLFTLILAPLLLLLLFLIVRPKPIIIPIKNRHVFISGGSSGIGLALAQKAVSEGARVSLLARSLHKLEEAQKSIREAHGVDVAIFSADVRDHNAVERAVAESGPIDVLVVNQGIFVPGAVENQASDVIKSVIDVNLTGSFNVIKAALPWMKKRKDGAPASIALMSSQAGQIDFRVGKQVGIYGYSAYSATKFGLRGLAEALQQELISDNIHVSVIYPPDTQTPGFEQGISSSTNRIVVLIRIITFGCFAERKIRPELAGMIMGSGGGALSAEEVAKKSLDGIKSGSFSIWFNLEGYMLGFSGAGFSPQTSFPVAFLEIVFAGLSRLAALFIVWSWYRIIQKKHAN
ncbi:hypothetical protein GQ457_01G030430 [Hibiscus cannabinus]